MMQTSKTTLRRATDDDVDRLVAWHADPDVSRYWDDETFTRDEVHARLARPDVEAWIVEAEGEPVGYLQVHSTGWTCSWLHARVGEGSALTQPAPWRATCSTSGKMRAQGR